MIGGCCSVFLGEGDAFDDDALVFSEYFINFSCSFFELSSEDFDDISFS